MVCHVRMLLQQELKTGLTVADTPDRTGTDRDGQLTQTVDSRYPFVHGRLELGSNTQTGVNMSRLLEHCH